MPVCKILKNYIFVTGRFGGKKGGEIADFESTLEKEYMLLLEFDETVDRFETQPGRVPVAGVAKGYVPDVLLLRPCEVLSGIADATILKVAHNSLRVLLQHRHMLVGSFA